MNVLIDTPIWSLALRRKAKLNPEEKILIRELKDLIKEVRASIIGPIRQELLSGISKQEQFELLKQRLHAFTDVTISTRDYETAAEFFNHCRNRGIQGSHIDFLICAVARHHEMLIFTSDKDFLQYARFLPITMHHPRKTTKPPEQE